MKKILLCVLILSISISACNNASSIDVNNIKTACEFVNAYEQVADRIIELTDKHGDLIYAELKSYDKDWRWKFGVRAGLNPNEFKSEYTKEYLNLLHIADQLDSLGERKFSNDEKRACPNSFEIDAKVRLMHRR